MPKESPLNVASSVAENVVCVVPICVSEPGSYVPVIAPPVSPYSFTLFKLLLAVTVPVSEILIEVIVAAELLVVKVNAPPR